MRAAPPDQVRSCVPDGGRYIAPGTDGFGRGDTRAQLRAFFCVDRDSIVRADVETLPASEREPRRPGAGSGHFAMTCVLCEPARSCTVPSEQMSLGGILFDTSGFVFQNSVQTRHNQRSC